MDGQLCLEFRNAQPRGGQFFLRECREASLVASVDPHLLPPGVDRLLADTRSRAFRPASNSFRARRLNSAG